MSEILNYINTALLAVIALILLDLRVRIVRLENIVLGSGGHGERISKLETGKFQHG